MKVSEAIRSRRSVRGFLERPVDPAVLRRVLTLAGQAPSGGNLQPWHVAVITGAPMAALIDAVAAKMAAGQAEPPEYAVYPPDLPEPYRSRRFAVGEEMYGHIGIPRDDRAARVRWFAANYRFFGAPVGLFVHTPRFMGPPQWADMGIWLQSLMLLLREEGLDSCPQEAWTVWPQSVRAHVPVPEDHILYTGMAIGWADPDAPANRTRAARAPIGETTAFIGF